MWNRREYLTAILTVSSYSYSSTPGDIKAQGHIKTQAWKKIIQAQGSTRLVLNVYNLQDVTVLAQ